MLSHKNIKLVSTKKIFLFFILLFLPLFVCGCSTLTYVGDDYSCYNSSTVKTSENFVFNVYKKSIDDANIKIGISKTPIMEVFALYIQIDNYSYELPYLFKVEDLILSAKNVNIPFIPTANYLNIWQNQEAASMAQMGSMGAALTTMTGMMTNYNEINQGTMQNAAQQTTNSVFNGMEILGNQISAHSIKVSSLINPRRTRYFYFFFENPNEEINVKYRNLDYKFKI